MLTRCTNAISENYEKYGARGIRVCDRWLRFEGFLADMGERPPDTSIDRIDPNGHYEPGNCRWASMVEQENNKRSNVRINACGRSLTAAEWSRETGIGYQTIRKRLESGWSPDRAVSEPVRR